MSVRNYTSLTAGYKPPMNLKRGFFSLHEALDAVKRVTGRAPKQNGVNWVGCCPAHDDGDPSLSIAEGENGKVLMFCHAGCSFEAIRDALGLEGRAEFVPNEAQRRRWEQQQAELKKAKAEAELKLEYVLSVATPAADDHPYLLRKGVKSHGLLQYKDSLVIPAQDVRGTIKTLQFIAPYPKQGEREKIFLKHGDKKGAFFVIGALSPMRPAVVVEGYATGASIHEVTGLSVVVAFDAGNMSPVVTALREAMPRLKLLIAGDNDAHKSEGNPGRDAARRAARSVNGGVHWCVPDFLIPSAGEIEEEAGDNPGKAQLKSAMSALRQRDTQRYHAEKPTDFNDLMKWSGGAERLQQQIAAALDAIGLIEVKQGDIPKIVRQAEAEVLFHGGVYQRSGELVRVVRHDVVEGKKPSPLNGLPPGALRLTPLTTPWLTEQFAKTGNWQRWSVKDQKLKPTDPPEQFAKIYLSKSGEWRAPVVTGIVECPTLRADGSLLNKPGYDPESGLYLDYSGDPISVPDAPTREQALEALLILKEPYSEFTFADPDVGISIALASSLTAVSRRSLRTAPMFAVDAPVMGAGKGLIVKIASLIATGRSAPILSQGQDEAEDQKRLGAMLLAGVPLMNLDNVERPIGGDLLCSMLTERECSPRILGKSESPSVPCNLTLFATGNNLQFAGDMVRRVLICRLDPGVERPDARVFRRNLNEWVPANRARLLTAALTVLRAYIVAGKPKQDIPPYGSYEEWSDLVRSALVWLGEADPCLSRAALEEADPVLGALHSILPLWHRQLGAKAFTAAEVCSMADGDLLAALLEVAASRRDSSQADAKRLGRWLMKYKGRVAAGLRIVKGEDAHTKMALWRVVPAALSPEPPKNPPPPPSKTSTDDLDLRDMRDMRDLSYSPVRENEKSHSCDDSNKDIHTGKNGVAGNEKNPAYPANPAISTSDEKPMGPHEADDNRLKLQDCRALKALRGLYTTQKQNLVEAGRPDAVPRIRMADWTRIAPRKEVDALIAEGMVVTDPGGFVSESTLYKSMN